MTNNGHHLWTQKSPSITNWIRQHPSRLIYTPQHQPITPNPAFPLTATLPMCTPLELNQTNLNTVLITISIPAETVFTLPTNALEIKTTRKKLKITQCRFYNFLPPAPGIPQDTPKLFLQGFVRKDIQYSEAVRQTATSIEGTIKDFILKIPISCVVDLGHALIIPPTHFSYTPPTSGPFSPENKFLSGELTEFNMVTQQFLNLLPHCELLFSQISEMDDALDRIPLPGGPSEEGVFRTLQEKMIILIQLRLNLQHIIDSSPVVD
ncbi:hypothetical protein [Desulfosporosinus sp. BG]|uniref:hypothetical protein n=1 Tax=Desulfosporosinus sp. BG TaxID=1633135 RepID=UPI000839DF48|nr:hypothetical protein [Desulfosporosinus sp. BG]ODA38754.1 hypothetical protein DSBG_4469 [Desulfosporosinus sp. BG]